jgi:hypothetical protein
MIRNLAHAGAIAPDLYRTPGGPLIIACECSGAIREAMRARGVDAVSCDLKPAEDGSRYHIQGDIRDHLNDGWAGMIAHPECRYLCGSGLHWNARGKIVDGRPRAELTAEALEFALMLWNANIDLIALENSVGILSRPENIGQHPQVIQPNQCGEDASKATCWFLKGFPRLELDPAERFPGRIIEWPPGSGKTVERWSNQTDSGQNRLPPSARRSADRARTLPGMANLVARNWARFFIAESRAAA